MTKSSFQNTVAHQRDLYGWKKKVSTCQKKSKEHSIKVDYPLKFVWKTLRVFPKSLSFSTLIPNYSNAEDDSYILSSLAGWIWKHHSCSECMMAVQDSLVLDRSSCWNARSCWISHWISHLCWIAHVKFLPHIGLLAYFGFLTQAGYDISLILNSSLMLDFSLTLDFSCTLDISLILDFTHLWGAELVLYWGTIFFFYFHFIN